MYGQQTIIWWTILFFVFNLQNTKEMLIKGCWSGNHYKIHNVDSRQFKLFALQNSKWV